MSSRLQRRSTDAVSISILISTVAPARWKQCSHEIGNRLKRFPSLLLAAGHRAKVAVLMRRSSFNYISNSYERLELRPQEAADWKGSLLMTLVTWRSRSPAEAVFTMLRSSGNGLTTTAAEFCGARITAAANFANYFNGPRLAPVQRLRADGNATLTAESDGVRVFLFTTRASNSH